MITDKFILKDGIPVRVELLEWAEWFEILENRKIDNTVVGDFTVSTIFLGIDYNFAETGDPLLFETIVFAADDIADYQRRWHTLGEAKNGHYEIVQKLRDGETL